MNRRLKPDRTRYPYRRRWDSWCRKRRRWHQSSPKRRQSTLVRTGLLLLAAASGCSSVTRQPAGEQASAPAPPKDVLQEVREETPPIPTETETDSDAVLHSKNWCPRYRQPRRIGTINNPHLNEISGVVVSQRHPHVLWTHNDSGDGPYVYALTRAGTLLSRHPLPEGTSARDWEDLARLPRKDRDVLFVADTGDNKRKRKRGSYVHRFLEPEKVGEEKQALPGKPPADIPVPAVSTMHVHYPDGPRNVEALLVDPWTGELVFVTKSLLGWAEVYTAPKFAETVTLQKEAELTPEVTIEAIQLVTAGDVSRDGHWIALRTYTKAYVFHRTRGQSIADALASPACSVPGPEEKQGESIAIVEDEGHTPSFLTISEGVPAELFFVQQAAE